jgi:hypothetical protein
MRYVLLLSLVFFLPTVAKAITGGELLTKCQASSDSSARRYCDGYVAGVASGAMIASIAMSRARPEIRGVPPVFCMPASTSPQRLTEIAIAFLTANPAGRRYDAASELILAFREAFPCVSK